MAHHSRQSESPLQKYHIFPKLQVHQFWKIDAIAGVINRLRIRQKIGWGYAICIGIAVFGAALGYETEKFYKNKAKEQLFKVHDAAKLVNQLQDSIQTARNHQQRILIFFDNAEIFDSEVEHLKRQMNIIEKLLSETQAYVGVKYLPIDNKDHKLNPQNLTDMMNKTEADILRYFQQLGEIINDRNIDSLNLKQRQEVKQKLINFAKSEASLEFMEGSHGLADLVSGFQEEESEEFQDYQEAEMLGTIILFASLLTSAAIAVILAIYTSRAIAHPLEVTTQVARQVTEEENFELQAPVTTADEVGVLTASLNQLIQWISTYTKELKAAQAQLVQTEKMSSLGQMVGGIAHEINNPVTFIQGNVIYLEECFDDLLGLVKLYQEKCPNTTAELQDKIDELDLEFMANDLPKTFDSIKHGSDRISQIVLSLRNFSRLDESELKAVDIHQGLDSTILMIESRLDGIKIHKNYDKLPEVECYPAMLNQAFFNILNNAIDALNEGGSDRDRQIQIRTATLDSDRIQIAIRDNGGGIAPEIQSKIFDPFFTTKPVGSGTGLGLSISYQIIEKHEGQIEVNSQVGEGTEFTITLPVKASARYSDSTRTLKGLG